MGFHYRKLLSDYSFTNQTIDDLEKTCEAFCEPLNDLGYCNSTCISYCYEECPSKIFPPTPSFHHPNKLKKILITTLLLVFATFVFLCCVAVYLRFRSRPRRRSEEETRETHDEFLDEDHGPVIDHPIWYIHTVGLEPSVISSITVCKYKRGDGLVEGTDCSVCLSEFQEDETLRLLPKCSHAFHIPCIDTWLVSHTNCPMCRAPIVTNASTNTDRASSSGVNNGGTSAGEAEAESDREMEGRDGEWRIETDEDGESQGESQGFKKDEEGLQPLRRSVSLDSLSAFKICQVLANVHPVESDQKSDRRPEKEDETNMGIVQNRVAGNHQRLLKLGSLQIGSSSLKRSISCSGKLFLSRYSRN